MEGEGQGEEEGKETRERRLRMIFSVHSTHVVPQDTRLHGRLHEALSFSEGGDTREFSGSLVTLTSPTHCMTAARLCICIHLIATFSTVPLTTANVGHAASRTHSLPPPPPPLCYARGGNDRRASRGAVDARSCPGERWRDADAPESFEGELMPRRALLERR